MNHDINNRIRSKVESFVTELSRLIKESAVESVRSALSGDLSLRSGRAGTGRPKGQKRSQEDIASAAETVFKFIEAHPESGVEHIGKDLGIATSDLMLPIRRLMADKRISKKGQKRGTKYSVRVPRK